MIGRWFSLVASRANRIMLLLPLAMLPALATAQVVPPAARPADSPAAVDSAASRWHSTVGGVRYQIMEPGTGKVPVAGSQVAVRYVGRLPEGPIFDQIKPSQRPLRFRVGRGEVIPGWDELLLLLPAGSRVHALIPARLAYADKGVPSPDDEYSYLIPPDTDLDFEIHLVSVR